MVLVVINSVGKQIIKASNVASYKSSDQFVRDVLDYSNQTGSVVNPNGEIIGTVDDVVTLFISNQFAGYLQSNGGGQIFDQSGKVVASPADVFQYAV